MSTYLRIYYTLKLRGCVECIFTFQHLWNSPFTRLYWFSCSSWGVDPVVSSHTQSCEPFTGCTKMKNKQTTAGGKKKQTKTKSELQNARRWRWHFLVFYVCSWLSRERSENHKQLPKMLTHQAIVFTAPYLRSWLHTELGLLWTHVLELNEQPCVFDLNFWPSSPESYY